MRDIQSIVVWLAGGVVVIGALPAAGALLVGFLLQVAVYGQLASGATGADEGVTGWLQGARSESPRAEMDPPIVWSWPVTGRLTESYGGCTFAMCPHWGIDIASVPGTPVVAAADGSVAGVGWDPDGYGHYVILAHGAGWQTLYAHLQPPDSSGPRLKLEMAVRRGDRIGRIGTSGASTGPHLHLEVRRRGTHVDPTQVLGPLDEESYGLLSPNRGIELPSTHPPLEPGGLVSREPSEIAKRVPLAASTTSRGSLSTLAGSQCCVPVRRGSWVRSVL